MKYLPYFIGFVLGFATAMIIWISLMNKPLDVVLAYPKSYCERQGFNSFTIDEHGNIICKNIFKNE